jgi:hypothetical protein
VVGPALRIRNFFAVIFGVKDALESKPSGGRKRKNKSLAEEKAVLARFAKEAGAGEMC